MTDYFTTAPDAAAAYEAHHHRDDYEPWDDLPDPSELGTDGWRVLGPRVDWTGYAKPQPSMQGGAS